MKIFKVTMIPISLGVEYMLWIFALAFMVKTPDQLVLSSVLSLVFFIWGFYLTFEFWKLAHRAIRLVAGLLMAFVLLPQLLIVANSGHIEGIFFTLFLGAGVTMFMLYTVIILTDWDKSMKNMTKKQREEQE